MSPWWFALPTLLLPVWWHRKKRMQVRAEPLASARFLPRTEPRQMRVWRWADIVLLLLRCLLLLGAIAWLADPVFPVRGDTVVVAAGTDARWAESQVQGGFKGAERVTLPADEALAWIRAHEREFKPGARLLVVGDIPMPATLPRFRHAVQLRTLGKPAAPVALVESRVAIFSERAAEWRRMFAAASSPLRIVVEPAPGPKTELIVWDMPDAPPANLRAPLWWAADAGAFTELAQSKAVGTIRYADGARGRVWTSHAWPPADPLAARTLLETWRRLHYAPVPYTAPSYDFAPAAQAAAAHVSGALREMLLMALAAVFILERILTHARRR